VVLEHPTISWMLLEHNADITTWDKFGKFPLHWVAMAKNREHPEDMPETMQLLLDHGADPNVRDNDGCTLLHDSSGYSPLTGTVEGSRLLLDHGANIDAENNKGKMPL